VAIKARFKITRQDFTLDVNLNIPGSGITAIYGDSGCGKTTLLRAIAGLEHAPNAYLKVGQKVWQDKNFY